jgi:tetratricopeptide (TPR) repeat protein
MLRLNERRELLRRQWGRGGIVFATTLDRFDEAAAVAPDLWTIRAMALRVGSLPAEADVDAQPSEQSTARRSPNVRSPQLARQAVERALERGDELGRLEALVILAQAESGESLDVAREARALAERLLQVRTDDEGRSRVAMAMMDLAEALAHSGRPPVREALELADLAVAAWRKLAKERPDVFLPDLAQTLSNLGNLLILWGRRNEALEPTQESVEEYRKLAKDRPDAHLPDLGNGLIALGIALNSLGRREEALGATQEAVEIHRKLAKERPDVYLPNLAGALNNLGIALSLLDRREEALDATQEAVEIRRRLAEHIPEASLAPLALLLNNLGNRLNSLGRREEALEATQEAVEEYRKLANMSPDAFSPDLALSLGALGRVHADAGEYLLARDCWVEGLRTILPLFAKVPAAHARVTLLLGRDLYALDQEHGIGIPEDLAAVVAQLINDDEPTRDH